MGRVHPLEILETMLKEEFQEENQYLRQRAFVSK